MDQMFAIQVGLLFEACCGARRLHVEQAVVAILIIAPETQVAAHL